MRRSEFWARLWPKLAKSASVEKGDKILVAVSGGPDSVCLAHALKLRSERLPLSLALAHVHHGLRGREADADERFVRGLAEAWGLPYYGARVDARASAKSERRSVEDAARKLRYAALDRLAREHGFTKVAVGHHADDQAETVLLHLLRGTDPKGLAGIPERRPLTPGGPELVRPLMGLTRAEVLAYLRFQGLKHRKDRTNKDLDRTRNWVRLKLLPLLGKRNPRIREHLVGLARGVARLLPAAALALPVSAQTVETVVECPASLGPVPSYRLGRPAEPEIGILRLRPGAPARLPALADDLDRPSAILAASRTREYWTKRPAGSAVDVGGRSVTAAELAKSFSALERLLANAPDDAALKRGLLEGFDLFESVADDGGTSGTITGYYDAELPVSREKQPGWVPVHARPADLETRSPYFTRAEIDAGALDGRGLELFWTPHAIDLYVIQVQGSGWAVLPDGSRRRLASHGSNGHPFQSVGRRLVECGELPRGTDSTEILRYIRSQPPERERRIVQVNSRYIFFREVPEGGGPWGSSGVELVAGRSIAVDPEHVPMGMAGFLVSRRPETDPQGRLRYRDFSRFVFSHDIGSAIRGATRVDLYWGGGPNAGEEARHMLFPGKLYVFVEKARSARVPRR